MDFLSDKSQEVIKTLCRTCMSVRANIDMGRNTTIYKQYLHEKPTGGGRLNLTIMELLQSVHPKLHISADDKLPQVLCLRCIDQLQTTYEFLKMCKDSDEKYRKRLCEQPQIISETHQQQLPRNNPATPFPLVTVKEEIDVMEVAEFDIDIKENDISTYSGSNSNNHRTEFQLSIRDCQTENNQSYGEEEEEEEDNDDTEWVVQGKRFVLKLFLLKLYMGSMNI